MHRFELGALRFVRRNLLVSNRCEREGMKRQDDILTAAIITQADIEPLHVRLGDDAGQSEIWRDVANFG
jgi:hypothetical protein